ncbi:MAG: helix-turn-helix domain-containing protein [Actinomycetota bacterium]|nr:helix-turn-helix domain-containing protein [Actinomycetota bacterium]
MKRADFAAELARRRLDAELSLAGLAAAAHVHRGYLHRMERGERWPSCTVVRARGPTSTHGHCLVTDKPRRKRSTRAEAQARAAEAFALHVTGLSYGDIARRLGPDEPDDDDEAPFS